MDAIHELELKVLYSRKEPMSTEGQLAPEQVEAERVVWKVIRLLPADRPSGKDATKYSTHKDLDEVPTRAAILLSVIKDTEKRLDR